MPWSNYQNKNVIYPWDRLNDTLFNMENTLPPPDEIQDKWGHPDGYYLDQKNNLAPQFGQAMASNDQNNPYQRSEPTWWDRVKDNLGALEPSDVYNMPAWALRKTLPQDEEGNLHFGINDPVVQKYVANEIPYAGLGMGFTKIVGPAGGSRVIQAFHDKTKDLLGTLGYKDVPGKGAIFQSIESQSPRGTAELLGRFRDEMGPLMNEVKVPGPIKAQSVPAFESMLNRGRLNEYPDLAKRLRTVLDESRANYGDLIPENTYQWNRYQR